MTDLIIPKEILANVKIDGELLLFSEKVVWAYITQCGGVCPPMAKLCSDLGIGSRTSGTKYVKSLVKKGILVATPKGRVNTYSLKDSELKTTIPTCHLYVQRLFNEGKEAIKFGNSFNVSLRVNDQSNTSQFEHELLYSVEVDSKTYAEGIENLILMKFGGDYLTKEELPDGYTETLPLYLKDTVIDFISSLK